MEKYDECVVVAENLHKAFHGVPVLKGMSFAIARHELTVLIGPSGCGKTTLLRCLNCLELMDRGRISIAGISLERSGSERNDRVGLQQSMHLLRQQVGMVFQSFNLFPHMTVLQNVMKAPVVVKKVPVSEARQKSIDLLEKVGLGRHLHHYPSQLSGGQQQRAAIARALAMEPQVMLYDEPTSALDPGLVEEVLNVMKQLHDEGMTQIVVTHEMRFARDVADKIFYIEDGQIVEAGLPHVIFQNPTDSRTRRFLKNFL